MRNDTFTKNYDHILCDQDPRITPAAKLVYMYLLRFHESKKIKKIFPSVTMIAVYTMQSESSVKRATRLLLDLGLITRCRRFNSSNVYEVQPYTAKGDPIYPEWLTDADEIADDVEDSQTGQNDLNDTDTSSHSQVKMTSQTGQNELSSQVKLTSYEISLEDEKKRLVNQGESQNTVATLSRDKSDLTVTQFCEQKQVSRFDKPNLIKLIQAYSDKDATPVALSRTTSICYDDVVKLFPLVQLFNSRVSM